MPNQHPITLPQELVLKWHVCAPRKHDDEGYVFVPPGHLDHIATQAAQWGSDQELEACLGEIRDGAGRIYIDETRLRVLLAEDIWTARRPKPSSLKEQALEALEEMNEPLGVITVSRVSIIRRALEALDD
jgi:hypothetical protein